MVGEWLDGETGDNSREDEKRMMMALVRSVPEDEFAKMCGSAGLSGSALQRMMFWRKPFIREQSRNETVRTLLGYYCDKKSRKVVYARKQLQERFSMQSYADQRRILRAFLGGIKTDCVWACWRLPSVWHHSFEGELKAAWGKFHDISAAYAILKCLPGEYAISQIPAFEESGVRRYEICSYLGDVEGFPLEISWDSLGVTGYLIAMAGLGREVDKEETRARFWEEVLSCSKGKILLCESGWGSGETDSAWDECLGFGPHVFNALEKLGQTELLAEIAAFDMKLHAVRHGGIIDYYREIILSLESGTEPGTRFDDDDLPLVTFKSPESVETVHFGKRVSMAAMMDDPALPDEVKALLGEMNL